MFVRVYSIWYLLFLFFQWELRQKADFINKALRNAYLYNIFLKSGGGGGG